MQNKFISTVGAALVSLATLILPTAPAFAQGTAFNYQGRLDSGGTPYTGSAEFQATLWNVATGGTALASNTPVQVVLGVTNGLFVLPLDFGANFPGAERWLQLEVRTTIGAFTVLTPRQPLTATPYAVTAGNLTGPLSAGQLSGAVPSANLGGTYSGALTLNNEANSFSGSGAGLTALNASQLTSGTVPDARLGANVARTDQVWSRTGNAGTTPGVNFMGTTDDQPLEFRVNGVRALRIEPATNITHGYSPNVVGGHAANVASNGFVGAVIVGGGRANDPNRVGNHFATVVGGAGNTASGFAATAMGSITTASGSSSTAMGASTTASGHFSTAMGTGTKASGFAATAIGDVTTASGYAATAMGVGTTASGESSTAMGSFTTATGDSSTAMGNRAKANHFGSFVWADSTDQNFASTANNQFLVRAAGGVGIGIASPGAALDVRTTSGTGNAIRFGYYTGGVGNLIAGPSRVSIATGDMVERISIPQSTGNVGLGTLTPSQKLHVIGNILASGSITPNSDVNAKTDFAPVEVAEILEHVLTLPIQQWRFKTEPDDVKHIGPMAQDFRAAFGLGEIPTAIATVDADGVALAAIQGLNHKVEMGKQKAESLEQRLEQKETEITELKQRLIALEQLVAKINPKAE